MRAIPLEGRPDAKEKALDEYHEYFNDYDASTREHDEKMCRLVEDVFETRDFHFDMDRVLVSVQQSHIKVDGLLHEINGGDRVVPASCQHPWDNDLDVHVLYFDAWVIENISEDFIRDIIAHELCHIETDMQIGGHNESDDVFHENLERVGAIKSGDDRLSSEIDLDAHPDFEPTESSGLFG